MSKHMHGRGGHRRGGPGGPGGPRGRERARRGAAAEAFLLLLGERPMHGYEMIDELDRRSDGHWRPSPGSVYPTLRRMEGRGVIEGAEGDDGKRVYSLTDAGRERLADRDPDAPAPWDDFAEEGASMRPLVHELMSAAKQVGRFGSPDQREKAKDILTKATADLYAVMADGR